MIYPGGNISIKRVRHCGVIAVLTLTLWMQGLQDAVVEKAIALATTLAEEQETIVGGLEKVVYAKDWYDWIWVQIGYEDDTRENDAVSALSSLSEDSTSALKLLQIMTVILGFTTVLLLLSIGYSCLWLALDLKHRRHKVLTMLMIAVAITINYLIHQKLMDIHLL